MLSSAQCWFQEKKALFCRYLKENNTEYPAGLNIKIWRNYLTPLMTESAQVESILCSLLTCTLHILTRTRLCQTKHGIMISTLLYSFCSNPSDHRELRTKLCLSLGKLFWFTNQGFPHTVILPWILKDWRGSCSYDHRLKKVAEMPCTGSHKSAKQERGLVQ